MKTRKNVLVCLMTLGLLVWATACQKDASQEKPDEQAEAVESSEEEESAEKTENKEEGAASKAEPTDEQKAQNVEKAEVGKKAPDFELTDTSGETHKLSDYRGKIVVLEWTNQGCPYVQRHYDADTMPKTYEALGKDKIAWLAVESTHNRKKKEGADWKKKEGFDYPLLLDKSGEVGKSYGAKTTPHMYVIDKEGVLQYAGAIDDAPRGEKEDPTNYVEKAVSALQAGKTPETRTTKPYGCSVKYGS